MSWEFRPIPCKLGTETFPAPAAKIRRKSKEVACERLQARAWKIRTGLCGPVLEIHDEFAD
jgi:hypothetical protein